MPKLEGQRPYVELLPPSPWCNGFYAQRGQGHKYVCTWTWVRSPCVCDISEVYSLKIGQFDRHQSRQWICPTQAIPSERRARFFILTASSICTTQVSDWLLVLPSVTKLWRSLSLRKTSRQKPLSSKEPNACIWIASIEFYVTNRTNKKSVRSKELGETSKSMSLRSTSSGSFRLLEPNA